MAQQFELLVRNGFVHSGNEVVDVGVDDGRITGVAEAITGGASTEIDAEGSLLSPGFVDLHMHVDEAFAARGDRFPKYNAGHCEPDRFRELVVEYCNSTPRSAA